MGSQSTTDSEDATALLFSPLHLEKGNLDGWYVILKEWTKSMQSKELLQQDQVNKAKDFWFLTW